MGPDVTRFLIVEDHPLFREALASAIRDATPDAEIYEAASIDGAGAWRRFRKITLPLLSPVLFFNVVMGIITTFQYFTNAYVMTRGGPGRSTLFYNYYLYINAFTYFKMGYASALAWILFLIILAFTALVFRSSPYWVYYENQGKGR